MLYKSPTINSALHNFAKIVKHWLLPVCVKVWKHILQKLNICTDFIFFIKVLSLFKLFAKMFQTVNAVCENILKAPRIYQERMIFLDKTNDSALNHGLDPMTHRYNLGQFGKPS